MTKAGDVGFSIITGEVVGGIDDLVYRLALRVLESHCVHRGVVVGGIHYIKCCGTLSVQLVHKITQCR